MVLLVELKMYNVYLIINATLSALSSLGKKKSMNIIKIYNNITHSLNSMLNIIMKHYFIVIN